MQYVRRSTFTVAVAVVASSLVAASASAASVGAYDRPGRTEMVSVSSSGKQMTYPIVNLFHNTEFSDVTPDGRYVAFATSATGLTPGDEVGALPGQHRVYVHDRKLKRTVQASVAADGARQVALSTGSGSLFPTVSRDGRYVAFASDAINLVPGDTNNAFDVFVKDLRTGRIVRASVSSRGTQADRDSYYPSISADGRYVAFPSAARNLIPGDIRATQVYRHDLKTGKTVLVSANLRGRPGSAESVHASISADGRYVAFTSKARDLVRSDSTGVDCECDAQNMFRRDLKTGKTVRVSVASDGSQASWGALPSCTVAGPPLITLPPPSPIEQIGGYSQSICGSGVFPSLRFISADGRYIGFVSDATNLVPNDTNALSQNYGDDVFVHDVKTGRTERVSVDSYGRERSGRPYLGGISAGGRYVHYSDFTFGVSAEPQDLINDLLSTGSVAENNRDAYVYDRVSGSMDQTSRPMSGKTPTLGRCGNGTTYLVPTRETWAGGISADGRYAAMRSNVTNLAPKDTNDGCDYFVRDRGPAGGVGGFGSQNPRPAQSDCVLDGVCRLQLTSSGSVGSTEVLGADLIDARMVPRSAFGDLFVRLDLEHMPAVTSAPTGGLLYGLAFTAGGVRYEARAQRLPGPDYDPNGGASFGLFRQDPVTGLYIKVAGLKGGYGTTGPSVVFAVPVEHLGAGGGLSDVRAFTALGSYLSGATKLLDAIRLAR